MALTITGTWLCQALVCFSVISSGYGASDYMSQFSQYDGEQGDYPVGQGDYQADYGHPGGMDILGNICEFPITPKNSRIECSTTGDNVKKRCKATCHDGYHFPTGETQLVSECNSYIGRWEPVSSFPDCEAVCDIDCLNDGKCQHNQCVCPAKFRGDRCQYPTSNCGTKTLGFIGHISCTHTQRESSCKVSCPQGYQFETPVTKTYVCDLEGTWNPPSVPRCLPTDSFLTSANDIVLGEAPSRYVGTCSSWGQTHYRTFDGRNFSFRGQCTYALAKDCVDSSFSIHVANDDNCSDTHRCKRIVKVYAAGIEVILQNNPITGFPGAYVNGKNIAIPVTVNGLLLEKTGGLIIMESDFGFRLRWDTKEAVFIDVTSALAHKTCGLCGVFDENRANDFTTIEGRVAASPLDFATSWKMNPAEDQCPNTENVENECSSVVARGDMSIALNAGTSCNRLRSTEYAACHDVLDPTFYIESCQRDTCKCGMERDDCFCFSFEAYFRECFRMNPSLAFTWRKTDLCPMDCSAGMEYNSCGTSCPRSCRGQVYDCEDDHCVEGCHCPSGSVLLDGRCVRQVECPCFYQGTDYPSGSTIDQDCNRCECAGGRWLCTAKKCEARCSVVGAHFTTFDGTKYSFRGSCTYYLIHNDTFSVELANPACEIGDISCVRHLTVRYNGNIIKLGDNRMVTVNGESVTQFPFQSLGSYVSATSSFTKVDLGVGLSILWDGRSIVYIDATENLIDQVAGLCGTFNFKNIDDFTTPEGHLEADAEAFATRWQKTSDCQVHEVLPSRDACDLYEQRRALADSTCSVLKSELFSACHRIVDVTDYFIDCRQDICRSKDQLKESLCPILALYASACANRGVILKWRNHVDTCALQCTGGQEYSECTSDCTATCSNIASNAVCSRHCVEGCECPEGEALDVNGHCIPIMTCPCTHSGKEYPAGADIDIQGSLCTCQAAQWRCANVGDSQVEDTSGTSSNLLRCGDFMEFTKCMSDCPVTCRAYANAPECSTVVCRDGCQCIKGYVLDGDVCVRPSNCKCMHGGATYNRDDQIKIDCNSCVCQAGGVWSCTEQECYGVCHVYGESHYRSYDQKEFRMQGECTYVMAKSADGVAAEQAFRVTVENIECGSGGTTCSRTVIIQLGGKKVVLQRDRPVVAFRDDIVTVKEVGLYVIVQSNIGVSVEWDKGTSVYVRLSPRWKTRVNGLCGNYNGNAQDDFTTPAGGPPLALATEFADSWRVYEHCLPSKAIEDTCRLFPHRKAWAQRRCGVIASEVFSDCHSLVPPESYMDRCVFDSCACDTGGDCECLCTAIAAYARACSVAGLPIKWRTQELCPIQCDCDDTHETFYNPCIPVCARSCNHKYEVTAGCEQTCVEGCDHEPCDFGEIWRDELSYECIFTYDCHPICATINGITYNENDRVTDPTITDECQTCFCQNRKIKCIGNPCTTTQATTTRTTTEPPVSTVIVTPDNSISECGWSQWSNTHRRTTIPTGGDVERIDEILASQPDYCPNGEIIDIACRITNTGIYANVSGQVVTCNLDEGLACKNSDQKFGKPCYDFEAQVFCDCNPRTTTKPPTTTKKVPGWTTIDTSGITCTPGWTAWLNFSSPYTKPGFQEREGVEEIRKHFKFCSEDEVEIVQCRDAVTKLNYLDTDDIGVTCEKNGVSCLNLQQQDGLCSDYEIRFFCKCSTDTCESPLNIASQFATDTTLSSSSLKRRSQLSYIEVNNTKGAWSPAVDDRQQWIQVSFENVMTIKGILVQGSPVADEWVTKYLVQFSVDGSNFQYVSVSGVAPQIFEANFDRDTIVTNTFLLDIGAAHIRIVPVEWNGGISMRAELIGCNNNNDMTTLRPPVTVTTELEKEPTSTLSPECVDGWTQWMDSDTPFDNQPFERQIGVGDNELISQLRLEYAFCELPIDVECRTRDDQVPSDLTREQVTCDADTGFSCLNNQQYDNECENYEVRFFCQCNPPLTRPSTTLSPTTTTSGSNIVSCLKHGWSEWMNSNDAEVHPLGDIEDINKLRQQFPLCQVENMEDIQCRVAGTKISHLVSGYNVRCDVLLGLRCINEEQVFGPRCPDFEISVYCNCLETTLVTRVTLTTTEETSTLTKTTYSTQTRRTTQSTVTSQTTTANTPPLTCASSMNVRDDGEIRDDQITASTSKKNYPPHLGRLDGRTGWRPRVKDDQQYIEVRFDQRTMITGVETQGHATFDEWVTGYQVSYSVTGLEPFIYYRESADLTPKVFSANDDQNTGVTNWFNREIAVRAVRLHPLTWKKGIGLRMELYGCIVATPGTTTARPISTLTTRRTLRPQRTTATTERPSVCELPMNINDTTVVRDNQMLASTEEDLYPAYDGRLNSPSGWVPRIHNSNQYIEVRLNEPTEISGVVTQGHKELPYWVTNYRVSYSVDGRDTSYYSDSPDGNPKVFTANTDQETPVTNLFTRDILIRVLRIHPVTWKDAIGMRFELVGCNPLEANIIYSTNRPVETATTRRTFRPKTTTAATERPSVCEYPMNIDDNAVVRDNQIIATTEEALNPAYDGRLNSPSGWVPRIQDENQYIEVRLHEPTEISGVVTQGHNERPYWVTNYRVSYSVDGRAPFTYYSDSPDGNPTVFTANTDQDTPVTNLFTRDIPIRVVRIHPVTWNDGIGMRFELLGCYPLEVSTVYTTSRPVETVTTRRTFRPRTTTATTERPTVCEQPMNIDDNAVVKDNQIIATTEEALNPAYDGRLNSFSGWVPRIQDVNQYIEVRLPEPTEISGVVTQGHNERPYWVTNYRVSYSVDGQAPFTYYSDSPDGNPTVFTANTDQDTPVTNLFTRDIPIRVVRIHPVTWNDGIGMRFELLGCYPLEVSTVYTTSRPVETVTTRRTFRPRTTTATTERPTVCEQPMNIDDNAVVKDNQIIATTEEALNPAYDGRLNSFSGWVPRIQNVNQYIEVRLPEPTEISGVVTQGHNERPYWVTNYRVSYSVDGRAPFTYYSDSPDGNPTVFTANTDQDTPVTNLFTRDIPIRVVRIHPVTWNDGIGMRFELLGCYPLEVSTVYTTSRPVETVTTRRTFRPRTTTATTERPTVCEQPMNIDDNAVVKDNQIIATTEEALNPAYDGRLNSFSGWVPRIQDVNQYIEVRLPEPTEISGVVTQGHNERPYWVTNYRVSYSVDGRAPFTYYSDSPDGNPTVFTANTDQDTPVTNLFTRDIPIRVVRIHPVTWNDGIGMRFELLGCYPLEVSTVYTTSRPVETVTTRRTFRPRTTTATTERPTVCEYPMNIDDNAVVKDNQIIATTEEALNPAYDGRLNSFSGWVPRIQDVNQYIEVRLPEPTEISGVVTQGHNERPYWVTNYRVSYSVDGRAPFTYYSDSPDGNPTVFTANTDQDTPVTNLFTRDIPIRVVRIHPVTWNDGIGMRFELLGCYPLEVSTVYTTSRPVETVTTRRTFRPRTTTATTERPTVCEYPMNIDDNAVVKDNQIIATTEEALNPAYDGRLNSFSGWVPRIQDVNQYIEVRLPEPTEISGVVTQGHNERPYWVTNYRVSYSVDGRAPFTYYSDSPDGNPTVFTANTDQDTPVTNLFTRDIPIRVVRIHPVTWNDGIGMRFELLGCYPLEVSTVYTTSRPVETVTTRRTFRPRTTTATTERPTVCEYPMNIDDNAVVKDNQIIATTEEALNPAYDGRLNSFSGWVPRIQDVNQYIEVRLPEPTEISGVVTQGHNERPYWVTNYRVSYSVDGRAPFTYYSDSPDGNPTVFTGNTDQDTPVTNLFTRDIPIRVVRIHPVTWNDGIGMRFELLGCYPLEVSTVYTTSPPVETVTTRRTFRPRSTTATTERPTVCEYSMNIDDNAVVRDNQIIATTEEALNPAYDGRLNSLSGWVPRIQDVNQYIEVRLHEPTEISGVVTQGHNERPYWVTNYRVSYSVDGRAPFTYYSDSPDGNPTVFTANTDQDTLVTNLFTRDIPIRVLRIHPVTWNNGIGMRFELLGCYPLEVSTVYTTSRPVETVTTRRTFRPRSTTATTERPTVCEYPMNIDDNAVVRDNQIIATTEEALNPAYDGRLNSLSGWVPRIQDVNQYIEVRLHEPTEISGVVTQGHNERPYWVTNYRVSYSVDGRAPFTYYSDSPDGNPTVFTANTDQDTPVTNLFTRDIPIRVLRIHPVTWNNGIGMRFELLGCYPLEVSTVYTTSRPVETVTTRRTFRPRTTTATTERPLVCEQPMNIDDNAVVRDNQIIATTEEALNPAYEGRLNSLSGWVPRKQDLKQYIEVRLREPTEISGVVTQGHNELPYWVTNYRVSYSVDGREPFTYYSDSPDQNPKVFTANTDQHTPVTNMFTRDIPIRVLRIHPVDWFNEISLRFELLGCQPLVASTIFTTRTPTSTVTTRRTARPRTTTAAVCPPGLVYDECPYRCNQRCHYFYQTSEECRQYGSTECVPGCVPDCQPPNVWRDEQTCVASKECTCRMLDGSVAAPGKVWFDGVCEECRCWNNTLECYTRKQCHNVTVEPQIKCNDTLITLDTKTTSTSSQEEIGFTHSDNGEGVQWIAEIDDTRQYLIIELEAEDSIRSLITQGRPYESIAFSGGQVTSFYLMHSTDGSNWEEYMENGRPKLFEADTKHPDIPVTHTLMSSRGEFLIAKYLMIRPATWNNHIAIRAYVIGCYEAIATTVTTPVTESTPQQVPTKSGCEFETPYVNLQHPSAATTGDYELVFDVASAAGFCEFPIGILCRDSVTKLFYDETGEVVTCDLEIGLVCNDNDQIPGKYCSDYEVSIRCPICGPQLCPFVTDDSSCPRNCPPGYVCDGRSCIDPIDCACVVEGKRFKAGDIIVNTNCESCSCFRGRASCVPTECPVCVRDQVEYFSEDCECSCVCPPNLIECPANGKCIRPEYWCDGTQDCDQNEDEIDCPVESTTSPSPPTTSAPTTTVGPQPLPPTCTVIRNNFKTFDGVNYSYEICDHILMEQLDNTAFSVSVRLLCPQDSNSRSDCVSQLTVEIDSTVILVRPDLSVLVNELYYTPDELQLLRIPHVVIKHVGNQIIVRSLTYGFSVQWDASMEATIKILDKRQLIGKVAGLCGFYNDEKRDDFMKPDGTRSLSVKQFGDSWGSQIGCIPQPKCTDVINAITRSTCDALRGAPFSDCHNYVSPEVFIRVCEEEMCDCLATLNNVSKIVAEQCKCIAFEKYARACAIEAALDIEWRTLHMCEPTECPTNEVWSDCGPGCERTCDNWNEENIVCDLSCVPGCYCKPGLVRKGSTCVPRDTCLDCICIAYGDPHYYSFDNTYFFFNGNCTYVLARDTENLDFEVLAVNEQCEEQPETTCTVGTIVNYQGHTAEIYRGPLVLFDGVQLLESNLPHTAYGITVKHVGIHYIIEIPDIELDVRYTEENFGVQVKVPSTIYFNKTEGLCGPCNHNRSDDLLTSDGVITTDSDEFGYSWLVDPNDPTVNCEVKPTPECDYGNPTTMCDAIWNENFRRCHAIVDPNLYYESCLIDVKCTQDPSALNSTSCSALSIYAGICALSGICLDWRTDDICPINCEGELQYQECGSVCEMTCANYEHFNPEICKSPPVSGCFCPPGLIDVDGQCKEIGSCEEPCDSEGHIVGDEWRVNECTVCMCTESGKACTHEFCPPPPSCSDSERLNKYELPGKCCAEYNCECDDRKCPPEVLPICPFDQIQSVVALNQCCTSVVCVCPDEATCRESVVPTIEEGEQIIIDDRYCCETYSKICNESQCDSAPFCGESKQLIPNKPADKCCPSYECLCNPNTCPPIVVPKCEFDQVPVEVVNAGGCCRYFECKCSPDAMCPLPETPELDIGEVLQRDNNYCCETYIKVCVPDQCPAPPVCTGGFVLEQQKIPDKCCETYNCVYPANKCLYNETVVGRDRVVEYEPNETWNDGLCKHCQCVKRQPGPADNFYDPVCEIEKCPKITEEYEPVETHGKCCPDVVKMRCKFNEHVYLEHETWPSPDGDPCKLYSCQPNPDGTGVYALLSVTSCKTDCKRSEIYVPPRPERNICCGECIRDKCEDNGKLYEVGETWTSPESECVINECRRNGEVRQQYKECSPPQCPREQQILDSSGCCYECTDIPIITNPPSTCEPRPVVGKEVRFVVRAEGGTTCRNQRPVYGMKECGGTCDSSSTFNTMINDFESDCKCCTVTKEESAEVVLQCDNGHEIVHTYRQPVACACTVCSLSGGDSGFDLPTVVPVK